MKDLKHIAHRGRYLLSASLVTIAAAAPVLIGHASAYTAAVTGRSVTMSSSKNSATGVTYTIGFTETGASIIKSVDVDFCAESPIYGAACTVPSGLVTTGTALGTQTGTSGWTMTNTTNGHLVFSGATANTLAGISFQVNGVTNPSAVATSGNNSAGTFYARIYTYAAQTNDYSGVTTPGTVLDFGGAALSTASAYTITATVQETLKFCVYSSTCGDTPAITLGHSRGGVTVIDSSAVDSGSVKFDVGSNANGNVAINLYGDTLKNGTVSSIPAQTTPGSLSAGTAGFCLYLTPGANVTTANSYGTTTSTCKLDNNGATGTMQVGGQKIASATPQTTTTTTTVTYSATASTTTPAGVYTASHQLIATGTF